MLDFVEMNGIEAAIPLRLFVVQQNGGQPTILSTLAQSIASLKGGMAENPRLTSSLRAFSGVGVQSIYPTEDELRQELVNKRKRRSELQSLTWRDFKRIVDDKIKDKDKKHVCSCQSIVSIYHSFLVLLITNFLRFLTKELFFFSGKDLTQ